MAATPFRVKAVYDYTSGHADDLSFFNGEIITVTDVEDDDWYYGEYADGGGNTKQGLFPKNFVERYEPVTPPRPSRLTRREQEPELPSQNEVPTGSTIPITTPLPKSEVLDTKAEQNDAEEEEDEGEATYPVETTTSTAIQAEDDTGSKQQPSAQSSSPVDIWKTKTVVPEKTIRSPPPSLGASKSPPPAAAESSGSSSFKDRIAAFNKATASPLAPGKPGQTQGSSFIKKPFVPPPPSRDAYVPIPREPAPQRIYQREESSALSESMEEHTKHATPSDISEDVQGDQPKPTSLKERIALLQKQQLEQAARHAELASKKEKPKKPPPRKKPEVLIDDDGTGEATEHSQNRPFLGTEGEEILAVSRLPRTSGSKDRTPIASPDSTQKDFFSDPNDADQSAGGETEDGDSVTAVQAPRQSMHRPPPIRQHSAVSEESESQEITQHAKDHEDAAETEENEAEDGEEGDEQEIDPEIRRRMEIRERMAKMSGGMGMAGMFGPPGGLSSHSQKKAKSAASGSKYQEEDEHGSPAPMQPVPVMALPGMAMFGRPTTKDVGNEAETQNEDGPDLPPPRVPENLDREENPSHGSNLPSRPLPPLPPVGASSFPENDDAAYDEDHITPVSSSTRAAPPVPGSQDRKTSSSHPLDCECFHDKALQRSKSDEFLARPPPPIPPAPAPASSQFLSTGEDSDDELSTTQGPEPADANFVRRGRPPIPVSTTDVGSEVSPISPISPVHEPQISKASTFPQSASLAKEKRMSRPPPPVPTIFPSPPSLATSARGPPPLPPPTRDADNIPGTAAANLKHEDSEEVTEYEGDYDTDIAAGESHKDALTAEQSSSAEETLTGDEASYHHSGLPSLGPPLGIPPAPGAFAPRGAPPPPPPREPPRTNRQSSDLPRSPPPPPPPAQSSGKSRQSANIPRGVPPPIPQQVVQHGLDYDPYNYNSSPPIPPRELQDTVSKPRDAQRYDDLHESSPPLSARVPPQQFIPPPSLAPSSAVSHTRQSLDTSRSGPNRSSTDARPSMDQLGGNMAHEIDVGRSSNWWLQRKMPPPSIQPRSDVAYEIEESTAIQQDGSELTLKHVYILFMDYSQTILTARFSQTDPSSVEFTQRYEPPPGSLRQDQLENAHGKFGARIAEAANQKLNHVVGNGSPTALITELLHGLTDAVPAIGNRTFGAVVYANIANATVQQLDEIRTGDIITFRNAKLQGHKGPMKQKYNIDIGKPDHAAVVVDWDGTKKKIRAWEQGRESKKVKVESFKLGDLKSGEVKIWRVVGRDWVGWGNKL